MGSLAFSLRFTGTTQLTSLPALPSLYISGRSLILPVCIFTLVTNWVDSRCVRGSHPWSSQGDLRAISSQAETAEGHGGQCGKTEKSPQSQW